MLYFCYCDSCSMPKRVLLGWARTLFWGLPEQYAHTARIRNEYSLQHPLFPTAAQERVVHRAVCYWTNFCAKSSEALTFMGRSPKMKPPDTRKTILAERIEAAEPARWSQGACLARASLRFTSCRMLMCVAATMNSTSTLRGNWTEEAREVLRFKAILDPSASEQAGLSV